MWPTCLFFLCGTKQVTYGNREPKKLHRKTTAKMGKSYSKRAIEVSMQY